MSFIEYMVPEPYQVPSDTPFLKVFNLFKSLQLRHLPIMDLDHQLVGIITRKDIFAYSDFFIKNYTATNKVV